MATKDWTRLKLAHYFTKEEFVWDNQKNNHRVKISSLHTQKLGKWVNTPTVVIKKRKSEVTHTFKTKLKALQFAKAYMKKN